MTNPKISAVIYSYKGKELKKVVETLIKNTYSTLSIYIIDQHPMFREDVFLEMSEAHNVPITYQHVFWDHQDSPIKWKKNAANETTGELILHMSDDILVEKDWDVDLCSFIGERNLIVSGNGKRRMILKDKFYYGPKEEFAYGHYLTNYVDRNFLIGPRDLILSIEYPDHLKYDGEEEMLSILYFCKGIDIYSASSDQYTDLGLRPLDNLYVPFSKQHWYNSYIGLIKSNPDRPDLVNDQKRSLRDFVEFHKINPSEILPLFYQQDDVMYDPNALAFQDVEGERFVGIVKGIF